MNRLEDFAGIFDGVTPWAGEVPQGYGVDFLGGLHDATFWIKFLGDPASIGGRYVTTALPRVERAASQHPLGFVDWSGEQWFEAVDWFAAARAARDQFVMITLGALYGAQAVGSYLALQQVNPMPCKLVAVEPVPENAMMVNRHFRNNGIDPDAHWVLSVAVSNSTDPVLFPIGPGRVWSPNCFSSNERVARESYYRELVAADKIEQALRDLLLRNSTGIKIVRTDAAHGSLEAEIRYLSSITLSDVLGPFSRVDYLESDIQQAEKLVFPAFMDLLRRKVRRIHIGTHGGETHAMLHDLFAGQGWEIVFSYEPETEHETLLGTFKTQDGILTVRNPTF
jgi:hypothetical protein